MAKVRCGRGSTTVDAAAENDCVERTCRCSGDLLEHAITVSWSAGALGLVEWRVVLSNCKCDDKPKVITCSTLRDADCADAISGVSKLGESETKTMRQVE